MSELIVDATRDGSFIIYKKDSAILHINLETVELSPKMIVISMSFCCYTTVFMLS